MKRLAWASFGITLLGVASAGCVEDALQYFENHSDAGPAADGGSADGGPRDAGSGDGGQVDSGSDGGADSGGPTDAGLCPSDGGCTLDWNTFLQCGPSGATLCFPLGAGFRSTFQAVHGPAAGFEASAVAFSNGGDVWVGIAADGGISLTARHAFADAVTSLSVADEHDLNPYRGCAEAIFTLDGGNAGYLGFCQSGLDEGSGILSTPLPSPLLGMTWLPFPGNNLGLAFGPSSSYCQEGSGSDLGAQPTYPAFAIQGLTGGPTNSCNNGPSWWVYLTDAGMAAESDCLITPQSFNAPPPLTVLPPGTQMTATQDGGVAVIGIIGGQAFGFQVYTASGATIVAGPAGYLNTVGVLGGITQWGASSSIIRAAFIDDGGTPGIADLDLGQSPPSWTVFSVRPGGPGAAFVAPMYPHMLLRVDYNGQVSISYLPP